MHVAIQPPNTTAPNTTCLTKKRPMIYQEKKEHNIFFYFPPFSWHHLFSAITCIPISAAYLLAYLPAYPASYIHTALPMKAHAPCGAKQFNGSFAFEAPIAAAKSQLMELEPHSALQLRAALPRLCSYCP